jgi:hypothetical protein
MYRLSKTFRDLSAPKDSKSLIIGKLHVSKNSFWAPNNLPVGCNNIYLCREGGDVRLGQIYI